MKKSKIIGALVLVLLFSSSLLAQGITAKGIKCGLNIANLTGDDVENADPKICLVLGGFLTYELNEMFAIQPEVLFSMKGAKFEDEYTEEYSNYEYYDRTEGSWKLNYLEIPVLAKLNIPMESNVKPNIFIGPALGINLSATYDMDYEWWEKEDGVIVDEGSGSDDGDIEDIKGADFGLIFGAGVEFGKITVDARYNLGLSTIDDSDEESDVKNSVISIMLGYSF